MCIKEPPLNVTKASSINLEKCNFSLSLKKKKYMYCTVKVYEIGATKCCGNISKAVHEVQQCILTRLKRVYVYM